MKENANDAQLNASGRTKIKYSAEAEKPEIGKVKEIFKNLNLKAFAVGIRKLKTLGGSFSGEIESK